MLVLAPLAFLIVVVAVMVLTDKSFKHSLPSSAVGDDDVEARLFLLPPVPVLFLRFASFCNGGCASFLSSSDRLAIATACGGGTAATSAFLRGSQEVEGGDFPWMGGRRKRGKASPSQRRRDDGARRGKGCYRGATGMCTDDAGEHYSLSGYGKQEEEEEEED